MKAVPACTMEHPLTIAWVIKGDEVYGVRAAVLNLAQGVAARGAKPVFAAMGEGPFAAELRARGYPVVVAGQGAPTSLGGGLVRRGLTSIRNALSAPRRAEAVAAVLSPHRPDAVHVLWPTFVSVAARAAARLSVPCFWEMPNTISDAYPLGVNRRMYRAVCRRWGVTVLANSRFTGSTLGIGEHAPETFYLAVDPARFDPGRVIAKTRAALGVPADVPLFAIAARIDEQKGQLPFLEGLLTLDAVPKSPHLLLLGGPTDGPVAAEMRRLAAARGASDRLHFAGVVDDPESYYPIIDVAVNSRVDPEPFGLSVVEAMMMGRPVLVHALGGPAETVLDGQTGWHCQGTTARDWADAIRRVLGDEASWKEVGSAARAHALENFSIERVSARYLSLVSKAVSRHARSV